MCNVACLAIGTLILSTRRELANSTHNVFYCNKCKSLLSRTTHPDDVESRRRLRKEWDLHFRSCHDYHCVMPACAPQHDGDVRHKRSGNCTTNREDEKEADANYLYHTLGVTGLGMSNSPTTSASLTQPRG